MMTAKETIKALGGGRAVAEAVGVTWGAVRNWAYLGTFPPSRYLAFAAMAREKGVFLNEQLFQELKWQSGPDGTPTRERLPTST